MFRFYKFQTYWMMGHGNDEYTLADKPDPWNRNYSFQPQTQP